VNGMGLGLGLGSGWVGVSTGNMAFSMVLWLGIGRV